MPLSTQAGGADDIVRGNGRRSLWWVRGLFAATPALASAGACLALAIVPERFPEDSGLWALSLHFAQPLLALVALVHGESLDSSLSTGRRLALFFGSLAVLGVLGLLFARDLLLDPMIASALGWAAAAHATGLFIPAADAAAEAARVRALAKDGWEFWALVSVAGVVAAGVVAIAVDEARPAWATLIPAGYFLVMAVAMLRAHGPAFAQQPAALSDCAFVRALWALFPGSRTRDSHAATP